MYAGNIAQEADTCPSASQEAAIPYQETWGPGPGRCTHARLRTRA